MTIWGRGKPAWLLKFLVSLIALFLLGGCAPKAGLFPLDSRRVGTLALEDEKSFEDLAEAVGESIRYYRRLPGTATFRYGDEVYTPREMEASMRLFLEIVGGLSGKDRLEAIRERFLFFESRNDSGRAFFTGYYEPVLPGSLAPSPRFSFPLYAVPGDLVKIDLAPYIEGGLLPEDLENRVLRGKVLDRSVVPFDDRDSIAYGGSLAGRADILAYVANHIELAFLQIQGSGLLRLEDGTQLRLNYADQNGHPYRPIGRVLLDVIPREKMSLQRIRDYLYEHPGEVRKIMEYNPSYTFFRLVDEGPLGNLGVPLTPGRSIAMDHRLLLGGGLVYFTTSYPPEAMEGEGAGLPFSRFAVVQDTGGAIRGHGRADIFWGSGGEAERIAGPMKEMGKIFLLVARKEFLEIP